MTELLRQLSNMSLRSKLLLVMVLLPFACLAVFLTVLVSAFIRDKVTFVYEWNQLQSKYLSSQIDLIMARIKNNPDEALFKVHLSATYDKPTDIRGTIKRDQAVEVAQNYGFALCSNIRNLGWIRLEGRLLYDIARRPTMVLISTEFRGDESMIYFLNEDSATQS